MATPSVVSAREAADIPVPNDVALPDYDDFQAKGWTTKELIPLMKKHETYQRASNNRDLHGFEGPIKVSFGNYTCGKTIDPFTLYSR